MTHRSPYSRFYELSSRCGAIAPEYAASLAQDVARLRRLAALGATKFVRTEKFFFFS